MSDKTGPLTFDEFETLTNLLRRFEVNHAPEVGWTGRGGRPKLAIQRADQIIRHVYSELYVPDYVPEGTTAEARDSGGSPIVHTWAQAANSRIRG